MTFDPNKHLIDIKGKKYLPVAFRIQWFRDDNPKGMINTDVVSYDPLAVKAVIHDNDGNIIATGHGSAEKTPGAVWTGREIEKAETAAIGRALAHAGYGTQFTAEDEGTHLSDSPIESSDPTRMVEVMHADTIKMVVDAGFFEAPQAAAQVLGKLFKQKKAPMKKVFELSKKYRSNKVETGDTEKAIELTLEA